MHTAEISRPLPAGDLDFGWCPDWTGETVALVASGPSTKLVNLNAIGRHVRVVAINSSYRLTPNADVLYACDARWYIRNRGAMGFRGLKVSQDKHAMEVFPEIKRIVAVKGSDALQFAQLGYVCWAGNSGMQALNMVAQWGVKRILLIGYDMTIEHGLHWHGAHVGGLPNPQEAHINRWRRLMDYAYAQLVERGIEAINCSPLSALKNYPRMSLEDALAV